MCECWGNSLDRVKLAPGYPTSFTEYKQGAFREEFVRLSVSINSREETSWFPETYI